MSKIQKSLVLPKKTPHFWIVTIMVRVILGCFQVCDAKVRQSRGVLRFFVSVLMLRNVAKNRKRICLWNLSLYNEQLIRYEQTSIHPYSSKETNGIKQETFCRKPESMVRNLRHPLQVSCGTLETQQNTSFAQKSIRVPVTTRAINRRFTSRNDGNDETHPWTYRQ